MSKNYPHLRKYLFGLLLSVLSVSFTMAQTVISGTITDKKTKEPLIGVSVQIKGKVIGTITDIKGKFEFTTSTPLPIPLVISSIGYKGQEYSVTSEKAVINISLEDQDIMGQEIVVSASRVEESVMKSAVTVEKLDLRAIRETAAPSFYDAIANMKGVDMTTQGLLFKSINMRGFGATGNPRTVQMIDGMDNSAPGLNFPVDNIVGMPELDVESVEILPGAASALYGPNAINGLILMNSKSPFLYQGLSSTVKTGVMNESSRATATTPFYDLSIRYAKAFNNKTAFKINLGYIGAKDWEANNYTNLNLGGVENGTRGAGVDPDYDGLNIYGDEVQANMLTVANGLVAAKLLPAAATGLVPNIPLSRTGFYERDLVDYNTKSFKSNFALHHRISEKVEFIAQANYGIGTTVYTGAARYSLKNFNIGQYKLELKGDNFNVRAYTTQERSGESYASGLSAVGMLNELKPHGTWFGQYVGAFVQARSAGQAEAAAHLTARGVADAGMPATGSDALNTLSDKYNNVLITKGGGSFQDKSNLYHAEGFYNFKNQVKFMDLSVGANIRRYQLQSNGTLFSDLKEGRTGTIAIDEFGGFIQASKSLFKDHFKLSGSMRYDKNENFEGQFTPRISGVFTFGQHNIRLSYQSGFRIPTTQNQYIDLFAGSGTLIGGLPEFDVRYKLATGIPLQDLAPANIAKFAADPAVQAQASQYATAAVTAQATPAITAGVNAAIEGQVRQGVTAVITQQVTAGATAAITAGVTALVTAQVTASVNALVLAGTLTQAQAAAAIQAQVAAALPSQVTAALNSQLASEVAKALPGALTANLASEVAKALPAALAANFQPAFNAELQKALAANVPGVVAQVLPAFALAKIPKYKVKALQPERIQSYEIGYKGLIGKKVFIDAYHYWSLYSNFIGTTTIIVPIAAAGPGLPIESGAGGASTRSVYSRPSNSGAEIKVKGWAANINYALPKGFNIGGNMAYNELTGFTITPEQAYAGFNTPKYRYNMNFGKRLGSGDKIGFNLSLRHQDSFTWESSFVVPTTSSNAQFTNTQVPKITNLDAQVSFKVPAMKSIIKVGGTNIGSQPYFQAFGSAMVGSMYYVAISYDELFNR